MKHGFNRLIFLIFIFFCFFQNYLFAQNVGYTFINVNDKQGVGIPYVSILLNSKVGLVSDSLGNFKLPKGKTFTVFLTSIAYKNKTVLLNTIDSTYSITLEDSVFLLSEVLVKSKDDQFTRIGYEKGRIRKMGYKVSYSFQEGVYITNENKVSGQIKFINFKASFKGKPKLPLRVNVYEAKDSTPGNNLLTRSIYIYPDGNFKWYKIDVSKQNILLPSNGIVVAIEIINPYLTDKKLEADFTPKIGIYKNTKYQHFIKSDYLPNWVLYATKYTPAVFIEIE